MKTSFYKKNLPTYINKLKSMVEKNLEIMVKEVECLVTEDKYYNVLKGRKTAAEGAIWGMKKVDNCLKQLENLEEDEDSSYYKEMLPELILHLEIMFKLDLSVIDIELDIYDDDYESLSSVKKDLKEILGKEMASKILRNASKNTSLSEDKLHNVIKSRTTAAEDCEWVMEKIDELQNTNSKETGIHKNWSKQQANQ